MPPRALRRNAENGILRKLHAAAVTPLLGRMEQVVLTQGEIIHAHGEPIEFVYFIEDGLVSVVATLEDGQPLEIGLIGSDGFVGAAVAMGSDRSFGETLAVLPVQAQRLPAAELSAQMATSQELRAAILPYVYALQVQVAQTAVCNARHSVDQRLARWLLTAHDQSGARQLPLTQEFLSTMLGVRRSTVTVAAGMLQKAGLIEYRHGRISIADRERLEDASCECYGVVAAEFRRLLG